jgi:glycine/D-amino acid oxidase-like deaminating enzyme
LFDEIVWPSLYERCEAFAGLKVKGSWTGFYEYNTLDQNGVIGPHRDVSNMVLCSGFSGHGLQQSPGAGRAVAELITSQQQGQGGTGSSSSVDVSPFSFDRIVKNEPVFEINIV